jgi:hypothetical protein
MLIANEIRNACTFVCLYVGLYARTRAVFTCVLCFFYIQKEKSLKIVVPLLWESGMQVAEVQILFFFQLLDFGRVWQGRLLFTLPPMCMYVQVYVGK